MKFSFLSVVKNTVKNHKCVLYPHLPMDMILTLRVGEDRLSAVIKVFLMKISHTRVHKSEIEISLFIREALICIY
jgi:hypothetical protein